MLLPRSAPTARRAAALLAALLFAPPVLAQSITPSGVGGTPGETTGGQSGEPSDTQAEEPPASPDGFEAGWFVLPPGYANPSGYAQEGEEDGGDGTSGEEDEEDEEGGGGENGEGTGGTGEEEEEDEEGEGTTTEGGEVQEVPDETVEETGTEEATSTKLGYEYLGASTGSTPPLGTGNVPVLRPADEVLEDLIQLQIGPLYAFANQVALTLGEFRYRQVDLHLRGRGLDIAWVRTYRSRSPELLNGPHGYQWDHSYNVYLEATAGGLVLHPGNGRADLFTQRPNGNYTRPDYFVVGAQDPGGTYTFTWPSGGTWNFFALDGSPAEGRLQTIVDRNGNTISLAYDGLGRLDTLTDTLGRVVTVGYDGAGRITSISDQSRTWSYGYYGIGDPNGSEGDLATVTTPAITGTPNGNDFPQGKTTTFTYTTGTGFERLDHNLATITDPLGRVVVGNTYQATTVEGDVEFDRLAAQTLNGSANPIQLHYVDKPHPGTGAQRIEVIVNDRRGAVREYLVDGFGDVLIQREFTGFADPALETTPTSNRPTGSVHAGAPPFYETRAFYNRSRQLKRLIRPEGNVDVITYQSDLNPKAGRHRAGLMRSWRRLPGPRGAAQPALLHLWDYHRTLPYVTQHTDPEGHVTSHGYDIAGNRVQTTLPVPGAVHDYGFNGFGQMTSHDLPDDGTGHRRRDEWTYHAAGPQTGYLQTSVRDVGGFGLTRSYQWNPRGALTQLTDERGGNWTYVRNQVDQLVRRLSPSVASQGNVRYRTDYFYDAADHLVQVDVQSRDETGAVEPNSELTTLYGYDALCNPTSIVREVDVGVVGTTELQYDDSDNLVRVRYDGAVTGGDPHQIVDLVYDERDLVFQVQRAPTGATPSTGQVDYDGNGNVVLRTTGIEAGGNVTSFSYDGYDRLVLMLDPMGNERELDYDADSRLVGRELRGELFDVPGAASNVRLEEASYEYDGMDRRTRVVRQYFEPATQLPLGSGTSEWLIGWDALGGITSLTDPNTNITTYAYDTAHRLASVTDARGNLTDFVHDAAGNVLTRTETHESDIGNPPSMYAWTFAYDELDRMTQRQGPSGPPLSFEYDSRGNVRTRIDERGNVVRYSYDGVDRRILRLAELTDTGTGGGSIVSVQATSYSYDYAAGLSVVTDTDGYSTSFTYDSLGRLVQVDLADGTSQTWTYDARDCPVLHADANGSTATTTCDANGRTSSVAIAPAPGVSNDTLLESFAYDGAGRVVSAADDDVTTTRVYDSLGRIIVESIQVQTQGGPVLLTTTATCDAAGNVTDLAYPGGRVVTYEYDVLNRVGRILEAASPLCTNFWAGPRERLERMIYANGTRTNHFYDGRLRPLRTVTRQGPQIRAERRSPHNATGQLTQRDNLLPAGTDFQLGVDSLGRLIQSDEFPSQGGQITITYALDDWGCRTAVSGGQAAGPYSKLGTIPPGDAQVHQYSSTPMDVRFYDENGNLTFIDAPVFDTPYTYDARDRLVERVFGPGILTTYAYDALGRLVHQGGAPADRVYATWEGRVLEEADGLGVTQATYVVNLPGGQASGVLDLLEVLSINSFTDLLTVLALQPSGGELEATAAHLVCLQRSGTDYFLHHDPEGSVAIATGPAGMAVERYEYADFGAVRLFDGAFNPIPNSAIGNPYLFHGERWDFLTGYYVRRGTLYDPLVDRSLSRGSPGTAPLPELRGLVAPYRD